MLDVRRLTKRYHSLPAVQDVSFTIAPGQVLGCLGPNGAGKSTTVKMLIGLLEPSSGQVLFQGSEIRSDLVAYRKQLGYVPEEPNLYPYLSGREYLEMVERSAAWSASSATGRWLTCYSSSPCMPIETAP